MQKYNFDLDLNSQNSNSVIVKHLEKNKDVLEFGPAFGRLTKYMREELNCNVDIVEMDDESGQVAAQFARTACVGEKDGNIENGNWENILRDRKFDFIIFADVLEHLHHPEEILHKCYQFLKDGGKILCSVPNIAHSSVLLSLWNNDFDYKEVGLLDNTHIHFFTRKTFEEMACRCNYKIVFIGGIVNNVGTNEIPWLYDSVPNAVSHELKLRKEGDIYQYIFELKKNISENAEDDSVCNIAGTSGFYCNCYIKEKDDADFMESKVIRRRYTTSQVKIYFDLHEFSNIDGVCIDLMQSESIIKFREINLDGKMLKFDSNGAKLNDSMYAFSNAAQIFIKLDSQPAKVLYLEFELLCADQKIIESIQEISSEKNNINYNLTADNSEKKEQIRILQARVNDLQQQVLRLQEQEEKYCENYETVLKEMKQMEEIYQRKMKEILTFNEKNTNRISEYEDQISNYILRVEELENVCKKSEKEKQELVQKLNKNILIRVIAKIKEKNNE